MNIVTVYYAKDYVSDLLKKKKQHNTLNKKAVEKWIQKHQ